MSTQTDIAAGLISRRNAMAAEAVALSEAAAELITAANAEQPEA